MCFFFPLCTSIVFYFSINPWKHGILGIELLRSRDWRMWKLMSEEILRMVYLWKGVPNLSSFTVCYLPRQVWPSLISTSRTGIMHMCELLNRVLLPLLQKSELEMLVWKSHWTVDAKFAFYCECSHVFLVCPVCQVLNPNSIHSCAIHSCVYLKAYKWSCCSQNHCASLKEPYNNPGVKWNNATKSLGWGLILSLALRL